MKFLVILSATLGLGLASDHRYFGDYCGAFIQECYSLCKASLIQTVKKPTCSTKRNQFECSCINYIWASNTDLADQVIANLRLPAKLRSTTTTTTSPNLVQKLLSVAGASYPTEKPSSVLDLALVDHLPGLGSRLDHNATFAYPSGNTIFQAPIADACSKDYYDYDRCVVTYVTRLLTSNKRPIVKRII